MGTSNLTMIVAAVAALLSCLLLLTLTRRSKSGPAQPQEDSPFAELISRNQARHVGANSPAAEPVSAAYEPPPNANSNQPPPALSDQSLQTLVQEDLRRGRKIEAIKRVREATSCGLKEAKEAVERFAATGEFAAGVPSNPAVIRAPLTSPRATASLDDPTVSQQARALLAEGKKIQAIKVVRDLTNCGLKDAKEFVESL